MAYFSGNATWLTQFVVDLEKNPTVLCLAYALVFIRVLNVTRM